MSAPRPTSVPMPFLGIITGTVAAFAVGMIIGGLAPSSGAVPLIVAVIAGIASTVGLNAWLIQRPLAALHTNEVASRDARIARLEHLLARRTFDARLARAVEATTTESEVVDLVARALNEIAPAQPGQLLLVDAATSDELGCAASTPNVVEGAGCSVSTLRGCRAVQHGHTETFDSSEAIDACTHLRGRSCGEIASVCVPLTVAGRNVGVLHVISTPEGAATSEDIVRYEELASQAASRISLLRAVENANERASTDPLTGAANRRSLEEHVRELAESETPFAVAITDLDNFKEINDSLGHDVGDQTLRAFAEAMRSALHPEDLVARFGGDEFVMVISDCTAAQAARAVERVRKHFTRTLAAARLPEIGASFGIADCTNGCSLTTVLAAADSALLTAKRNGRNQVHIAPTIIDLITGEQPAIDIH